MKIHVTVDVPLRKSPEISEIELKLDSEETIEYILKEAGYEKELEYIMCFLNNKPVKITEKVKDKDCLFITILVDGG